MEMESVESIAMAAARMRSRQHLLSNQPQESAMTPNAIQDFFDAFAKLTDDEKLAIHIYTRRFLPGTRFSSTTDLIHEVIFKVAAGERRWKPDISMGVFLAHCARSLSSAERKRADNQNLSYEDWRDLDRASSTIDAAPSAEDVALDNEARAIYLAALEHVKKELAHDQEARLVIDGLAAHLSAKETRDTYRLDEKAFKAARQRVHNRLKAWRSAQSM